DRQAVHLEGDWTFRPDAARSRQLPPTLNLPVTDYWLRLSRSHVPILTSPSREASDVEPTKPRMVLTFVEDRTVSMGPDGYITRAGVGESGRATSASLSPAPYCRRRGQSRSGRSWMRGCRSNAH